ncbi:MAG: T9SS type A sorting domain-containing protein [Bacteroidetes bacterium]|nr:T9SS type A sorting domain-containing protein [Bacteroidota bacterium]
MKSKIVFLKKVVILSCLLFILIFNGNLNAQIIYTDIIDATPNATYPLDLNNDSIVDFTIQFAMQAKVMCTPENNNAYSGEVVAGEHLPWALSASTNICDSLISWYEASNPGTMAWDTSIGHWVGATDKYLALKLVVGANTHYGWARFDFFPGSTSFTIKDYAYESTANACIQAGQTAWIPGNATEHQLSIFPNPVVSTTTLQAMGNLDHASLTVCNALGQAVWQAYHLSGEAVSFSRGHLPSGLYFVWLREEDRVLGVEKMVIAD